MVGKKSLGHIPLILTCWLLLAEFLSMPIDRARAESLRDDSTALAQALEAISADRMLADIRMLSGPEFNGRQTGTPDDERSAEFVHRRFMSIRERCSPAPLPETLTNPSPSREWDQSLPVPVTTIGEHALLHLSLEPDHPPASVGTDYLPVLDSPSADLLAPIVFVGYGIADPENGFDEYAGLEVRDKIVLFLRGKPERYPRQVSHADKVRTAREKGALGYLTATGPILSPYEMRRGVTGHPAAFYGQIPVDQAIPGAWISTAQASAILQMGESATPNRDRLRTLQQRLNETGTPQSVATMVTAKLSWNSVTRNGTLHNVMSIIRGRDHQEHAIVIGAHRDHFGRQGGLLFAGADDNASGTAVLLEVARVLAVAPAAPKRSIVLVSFSGEEQGLIGSRYYTEHPVVPLPSTVAMINVDHAGIGNSRLTLGVTGLDKSVVLQAGQAAKLDDRIDVFGFFPGGDHVPFKEAGVPTVTVVSGGVHPHFHQATDTAGTLDPGILTTAARYVTALAWQLANAP